MKTIRYLTINALLNLVIICGIFSSCTNKPESITKEVDIFEIHKYVGYKIIIKTPDEWVDVDNYIIRNDSIAIKLRVPTWFSELYSVGDTIK